MHPIAKRLTQSLRIPLIGAPLFIISNPKLVVAQCQSGVVGSFPALNARPTSQFDEWLFEIEEALAVGEESDQDTKIAPFAVNQIVHRSNDRLDADLEVTIAHKVPIVITSLGARSDVFDAVHEYGGIVFHDVINKKFAEKALEKGADGLIAVASGAGGHAGSTSPLALISEIREIFDGPLLLSGAIGNGASLLGAIAMGADFGYAGSIFIATTEANASAPHKEMVAASDSSDIVYTSHFTGVHGNYLKPSILASGLDPDTLEAKSATTMNFSSSGTNVKAWKDIWGAGHGIGSVKAALTTAELVTRIEEEFMAAKISLAERLAL
ncbi:NAD(P)H-dependent flavin oxidoreductase [Acidithrix ferrooxidans]|uniref:Nitronate monooxygenase n=1 Tax=Acidithrix ferrooxidans TaxID=1280514 RepID=A0A0D8HKG0_9ACTN|nr:nitronate monooxygenase family protein [Acidithrix ferrooxidans]KJF18344.1 nitronate monooxygenase [Acidithrix ferrooxidans]